MGALALMIEKPAAGTVSAVAKLLLCIIASLPLDVIPQENCRTVTDPPTDKGCHQCQRRAVL